MVCWTACYLVAGHVISFLASQLVSFVALPEVEALLISPKHIRGNPGLLLGLHLPSSDNRPVSIVLTSLPLLLLLVMVPWHQADVGLCLHVVHLIQLLLLDTEGVQGLM